MQAPQRLAIPIEVRQQKKPLILRRLLRTPVEDVFLLGAALYDIEDPVQLACLAVGAHVRSDVVCVDGCGLDDRVQALGRVFLNVARRAGIDEVQL